MRKAVVAGVFSALALSLFLAGVAVAQDSTQASQDSSSASTGDGPASPVQTNPTAGTNGPVGDSTIRQLGTPFPLALRPEGVKVGPLTFTDVSSSGFFLSSSAPGQASQNLWGDVVSTNIVYEQRSGQNMYALQARPDLSIVGDQAFLNEETGFAFSRQLNARWSLSATNQFVYFQNTQLQNPQYLLAYGSGGFFLQPLFAQQRGSSMYDTTNFSVSDQISGRTQLTITPEVGATVADQLGAWDFIKYFGAGVSVNHDLSASRSVSVSYNLIRYSSSFETAGYGGSWNTSNFGVGFRQQIGQTIWITGNLLASYQSGQNSNWMPTGNIGILKSFRTGNLLATYSRSEAAQVLLSAGYFDQTDIAYTHSFGRKVSLACGAGEFRTVQAGNNGFGKRVSASVSYQWLHDLAWQAGYNFSKQTGNQPTLNLGTTSYVSFGLKWTLGRGPKF